MSVDLPDPTRVQSLLRVAVTEISAGGAHTLVPMFCCRANSVGQLDRNKTDAKCIVVYFNFCKIFTYYIIKSSSIHYACG